MRIDCWPVEADELPAVVRERASDIKPAGTLFHPYWLVDVRVTVRSALLPVVVRRLWVAVDGVTGSASVPPAVEPVARKVDNRGIVPPSRTGDAIDRDRLGRAVLPMVSRRLRSWLNPEIEVEQTRLVYKELRLFRVRFDTGAVVLALDTLTGEYGVVPGDPGAARSEEVLT